MTDPTPKAQREADIAKAFAARLEIYRGKQNRSNPFGDDIYSQHEALRYVIEAIELLALEARIDVPVRTWG